MQKKQLRKTHQQLLFLLDRDIALAEADLASKRLEFQNAVDTIAEELDVEEGQKHLWKLDKKMESLIRTPDIDEEDEPEMGY